MNTSALVFQKNKWTPQQRTSTAGYVFNEADDRWVLDKDSKLNVKAVADLIDENLVPGYIATLSHFATNHSGDHAQSLNYHLKKYLSATGKSSFDSEGLINFRSSLPPHQDYYAAKVRIFLSQWNVLGYHGVSDSLMSLLNGWRIKGNIKGDAVKRRDPSKGPLTDNELAAFNESAARGFEMGQLSIAEIAMALLISSTGVRAVQVSHLRVGDLDASQKNVKGEPIFVVQMPRAKGRGESFRETFTPHSIRGELWAVLNQHAKSVIIKFEKRLGCELQESDRQALPLFPSASAVDEIDSTKDLLQISDHQVLHVKSSEINAVLRKVVSKGKCFSERTGQLLEVTAKRFRYTTGTRAAREGYGVLIIAELLDHRDTQNAKVYIRDIPDHVEALDRAMGHQLAPYAMAFAGVLVDREEDAERGSDPTSRIRYQGAGTGTCGMHGFCGANVPVPCYTCANFQPWLDGPHEKLYEWLHKERERILDMTKDETIAAVNDRTILAVAQVIKLCKARREELAEEAENG
ncbi:MAG: tyrosine-type recombinase/integrase [Nitrospira sp.]|nr:tyrosine-type recombinase/integrase [Nitrospira sp.]